MVSSSPATSVDSLYCYVNTTSQVQSIRLVAGLETQLEKLIFPGQKILLETTQETELEIVSCESGEIGVERIPCCA